MDAFNAEMKRTAVQRKAVSKLPAEQVLTMAIAYFGERGYRAGKTGRPNYVFVMGGREGALPRYPARSPPGQRRQTRDDAGHRRRLRRAPRPRRSGVPRAASSREQGGAAKRGSGIEHLGPEAVALGGPHAT